MADDSGTYVVKYGVTGWEQYLSCLIVLPRVVAIGTDRTRSAARFCCETAASLIADVMYQSEYANPRVVRLRKMAK